MTFTTLLLDCDGVVIKETKDFSARLQREHAIPDKDIIPFFRETFIPHCLTGAKDVKREVEDWLGRWNWDGTADELLEYWFSSESDVDEAVVDLVGSLRENGIRVYLVTNQEPRRTAYLREQLGFDDVFDGIYSSGEMGVKKPDSAFYAAILNDLKKNGVTSAETFYIDDDAENIAAAQRLGIQGVVYEREKDLAILQQFIR